MAKKHFSKTTQIADADSPVSSELMRAAIFKIDKNGSVLFDTMGPGVFLLNPSSMEESKSANWVAHETPGQSDPVLQWMSSGPRTLNFDALVTKDTSYLDIAKEAQQASSDSIKASISKAVVNVMGSVGSKFSKVNTKISKAAAPAPAKEKPLELASLDISPYLNYYRSLLYPLYDNADKPTRLRQSPPLVILRTGNAINKTSSHLTISTNTEVWVVTNLRIKITKQLPNLAPMEAVVSFQLMQYNIKSYSESRFTSYSRG